MILILSIEGKKTLLIKPFEIKLKTSKSFRKRVRNLKNGVRCNWTRFRESQFFYTWRKGRKDLAPSKLNFNSHFLVSPSRFEFWSGLNVRKIGRNQKPTKFKFFSQLCNLFFANVDFNHLCFLDLDFKKLHFQLSLPFAQFSFVLRVK